MQPPVKPYVLITVIILAIVLAFGVFLTVMYLQDRPEDNSYVVNVDGQDIVVNPDPNKVVIIVSQEPPPTPVIEQPVSSPTPIVVTNTPEAPLVATPLPITLTPVPQTSMYIFINHTVTGTDTLYSIANSYNTSIPLMARFGISSVDIVVGNTISIPVANPDYCPGMKACVVIEGDTPFGLASSAGISLEEFGRINNLDANYSIYETQVVCLP
jgi:LysM repeat protein